MPKGKRKGKNKNAPVAAHSQHQQSESESHEQETGEVEQLSASVSGMQLSQSSENAAQLLATEVRPINIPEAMPTPESRIDKPVSSAEAVDQSSTSEFLEEGTVGRDVSDRMVITTGLPAKQAPGKLGRPIKLICNLFPISLLPDGNIYHYDVKIIDAQRDQTSDLSLLTPDKSVQKYRCMSTRVNRKVIAQMLEDDIKFKKTFAVYDGQKNLYTPAPLKFTFPYITKVVIEEKVKTSQKEDKTAKPKKEVETPKPIRDVFKVEIKPVIKKNAHGMKGKSCAINLYVLHELFRNKLSSVEDIQEAVMALETVFRHSPALRYIPIGRNFFHPDLGGMHPLNGGIEIWFGYHQSLRLGQWKLMANLNTSATTFVSKQPLIEFVAKCLNRPVRQLSNLGNVTEKMRRDLLSDLKNLKVNTEHQGFKVQHCIIDITRESASKKEVKIGTTTTTVSKYFRDRYGVNLTYPHLPCIQVKPKLKNRFLPIEICHVPEGQHYKKELSDDNKAEMIKYTADPPVNRFNKIVGLRNKQANYDQDEYLKSFGIKVEPTPISLTGRKLEAPSLTYGNRKLTPINGSWNIRDLTFFNGSKISSWIVLSLAYFKRDVLINFSKKLEEIGRAAGLVFGQLVDIKIIDGHNTALLDRELGEIHRKQIQLTVVVIPDKNKELYRNVKQKAEVELGILTQCIDSRNVFKCNPSLLSGVCQKINAKMGGINHTLTSGEIPEIMCKPVIVIGADVSHAGVTDKSGISVASVAGSLDMIMCRFAVQCKLQKNVNAKKKSVEIIIELKEMVKKLLLAFYFHTNKKKPEKIVFFRDGVSDGQFSEVRQKEVSAIRGACLEIQKDGGYQPAVTFVVVQKRHHIRFRPEDTRDGVRPEFNVPAGTIADTTVVHPIHRDFFLCSQNGLKGTSRPAHYTVLHDDSEFTADNLQRLSYYSCNISPRCTKSISIPVPVAFAHLAAYRTRLRLATLPDDVKMRQMDTEEILQETLNAVELADPIKNSMYFV